MIEKKNAQLMSTPKLNKGTTPFNISGFSVQGVGQAIKVPIPNKTLFSDKSEAKNDFVMRSCDSLKSSMPKNGNKFTNML